MLNIFKLFDILLPLLNKIIKQMIDIEIREKGNSCLVMVYVIYQKPHPFECGLGVKR